MMRNTLWALAAALAVGAVPSAAVAQLPAGGRPAIPPQVPGRNNGLYQPNTPVYPQQDKDRRNDLQALQAAQMLNYAVREPAVPPPASFSVPKYTPPPSTSASEIASGFRAAETASHVKGAGGVLAGIGAGVGGLGALLRRKDPSS